jgi:AmiR/NasT family two-component response regulator
MIQLNNNTNFVDPSVRMDIENEEPLRGLTAIVAEDESITLVLLNRILRLAGIDVIGIVGDGQSAVQLAIHARPEMVILDVKMPFLSGLDAARHIRSHYDPCIIFVTAFTETAMQEAARGLGASGVIGKPVTNDTLIPQLVAAWERYKEDH